MVTIAEQRVRPRLTTRGQRGQSPQSRRLTSIAFLCVGNKWFACASPVLRAATAVAGGREFREAFGADRLAASDAGSPRAVFDAMERQADVLDFLLRDCSDGGECFVIFHGEGIFLPVGITRITECVFDFCGALEEAGESVLERLAKFVQVRHVRILAASVRVWLSCLGAWEAVGGNSKSCAEDIGLTAKCPNARQSPGESPMALKFCESCEQMGEDWDGEAPAEPPNAGPRCERLPAILRSSGDRRSPRGRHAAQRVGGSLMALTFLQKEHLAPLSPDRGEGSGVSGETRLPRAARTVQKDAGFTVSWKY